MIRSFFVNCIFSSVLVCLTIAFCVWCVWRFFKKKRPKDKKKGKDGKEKVICAILENIFFQIKIVKEIFEFYSETYLSSSLRRRKHGELYLEQKLWGRENKKTGMIKTNIHLLSKPKL